MAQVFLVDVVTRVDTDSSHSFNTLKGHNIENDFSKRLGLNTLLPFYL